MSGKRSRFDPDGSLTFDDLVGISAAFADFTAQRENLAEGEEAPIGPSKRGPAVIDLTSIWRAAQTDPGMFERPGQVRYMSPKRFINGWPHLVESLDSDPDGNVLADTIAAFEYCQRLDSRVMMTAFNMMKAKQEREVAADPIAYALAACKGGPIALMLARMAAKQHGWVDDVVFNSALRELALRVAETLDDYEAETLVDDVEKAIDGCPGIVWVGHGEEGDESDEESWA